MAHLVPENALDAEATPGERRLLRALHRGLDDECVIWLHPYLAGKCEADLLVYFPGLGLIIYEVKDWSANIIEGSEGDRWLVRLGGAPQSVTQPRKQARKYYELLNTQIQRQPSLRHQSGYYLGKAKLPIATAVAFPNITREQYRQRGLDRMIPPQYVLCGDEIDSIADEAVRENVRTRLGEHFDPWFQNDPLQRAEFQVLYHLITPQLPARSSARQDDPSDREQEQENRRVRIEQAARQKEAEARERAEDDLRLANEELRRRAEETEQIAAQLTPEQANATHRDAYQAQLEEQLQKTSEILAQAEMRVAAAEQAIRELREQQEAAQVLDTAPPGLSQVEARMAAAEQALIDLQARRDVAPAQFASPLPLQLAESPRKRPHGGVLITATIMLVLFCPFVVGFIALAASRGDQEQRTTATITVNQPAIVGSGTPVASVVGVPRTATATARATPTTPQAGTIVANGRTAVRAITWSPDGATFVYVSSAGAARLWATVTAIDSPLDAAGSAIVSVAWSLDGTVLAGGADDGTIHLWSAQGQPLAVLPGQGRRVNVVAWSRQSTVLASGDVDGTVRLWDARGRQLATLAGHSGSIEALAWSLDDRLASASIDTTIRLWSKEGRALATLQGHAAPLRALAWSPNGKQLASAAGNELRLWASDGRFLANLDGHRDLITSLVWSQDGSRLASGSRDATIRLWNASGQQISVIAGNSGPISDLAWSPNSAMLASAGDDFTIRLWDTVGQPIAALRGHTDTITALAWRPDGGALASTSTDATVRLWR